MSTICWQVSCSVVITGDNHPGRAEHCGGHSSAFWIRESIAIHQIMIWALIVVILLLSNRWSHHTFIIMSSISIHIFAIGFDNCIQKTGNESLGDVKNSFYIQPWRDMIDRTCRMKAVVFMLMYLYFGIIIYINTFNMYNFIKIMLCCVEKCNVCSMKILHCHFTKYTCTILVYTSIPDHGEAVNLTNSFSKGFMEGRWFCVRKHFVTSLYNIKMHFFGNNLWSFSQ